jgi:hypothetical protein
LAPADHADAFFASSSEGGTDQPGPAPCVAVYFRDPDIIAAGPSFQDLAQPNTAIKRLDTGLLWAAGVERRGKPARTRA